MKISYLVTCCNETESLIRLLNSIYLSLIGNDELIILKDSSPSSTDADTITILNRFCADTPIEGYFSHALNNDFGTHKNFGIEQCNGDFIFQCDADELLPESLLGENLHALIESNPASMMKLSILMGSKIIEEQNPQGELDTFALKVLKQLKDNTVRAELRNLMPDIFQRIELKLGSWRYEATMVSGEVKSRSLII